LKKDSFNNSYAACLGVQLFELLSFIENIIPRHVWYGADLDSTSNDEILSFTSFSLKKMGSISSLKKIANKTEQFWSGVFLAIKSEINIKKHPIMLGTEDPEFRIINLDGIIIEIRAFDTSHFEILSEDIELIKKIAVNYHVKIVEKTENCSDLDKN